MFRCATWIYSLPCQTPNLSVNEDMVAVQASKEAFKYRDECFGRLLYSRGRGPVFKDCYLELSGSNERLHLTAPIRVDIELTANCLLRCKHCYFGTKTDSELPLPIIRSLLAQLAAIGTVGIQLVGGEPFLYSDLPSVVNVAKGYGLKVEIFTGGFGAKMDTIKEVRGKVDFLAIDLDGIEATHDEFRGRRGSFKAALRMLDAFADSGTFVDVTMILSLLNLSEIEQVYEIAASHGASSFNVRLLHPSGEGAVIADKSLLSGDKGNEINARIDSLNAYGKLLVHKPFRFNCSTGNSSFFGCPGGKFSITVKTNGDVVKCNVSRTPLGNITSTPFAGIWNTITAREVQRGCDRVQRDPIHCSFAGVCGGPCELDGLDEEYCFSLATK